MTTAAVIVKGEQVTPAERAKEIADAIFAEWQASCARYPEGYPSPLGPIVIRHIASALTDGEWGCYSTCESALASCTTPPPDCKEELCSKTSSTPSHATESSASSSTSSTSSPVASPRLRDAVEMDLGTLEWVRRVITECPSESRLDIIDRRISELKKAEIPHA